MGLQADQILAMRGSNQPTIRSDESPGPLRACRTAACVANDRASSFEPRLSLGSFIHSRMMVLRAS